MRNRAENNLKRRVESNPELHLELAEWFWLVRGGVAKATILPDGSIKGMKLDDDGTLIEICIRKPRPTPNSFGVSPVSRSGILGLGKNGDGSLPRASR